MTLLTVPPNVAGLDALEDREIDARFAALTLAIPERASWRTDFARLGIASRRWRLLGALWCCAVVVAVTTLAWRPQVRVTTGIGPARVSCGLDIYVYGYPQHAVAHACRQAESGRLALFLPALIVVVVGVVVLLVVGLRQARGTGRWARIVAGVRRAPVRSALVLLGVPAAAVALFALRPFPADLTIAGNPVQVSCGANAYFEGFSGSVIQTACRHAYSGQAHVLVDAGAIALVGLVAFCSLVYSLTRQPRRRRRLLWLFGAILCAAVAVVALLPVPLEVTGPSGTAFASCGLDSYLAGYPLQSVQAACRSHMAGHALLFAVAGVVALLALAQAIRTGSRTNRSREDGLSGDSYE
jgi:hypothetical protein